MHTAIDNLSDRPQYVPSADRVKASGGATDSSWNAQGLGVNPEVSAGAMEYSHPHQGIEAGRLPTCDVAFPPRRLPGAVLLRWTVHAPPPAVPRGRPQGYGCEHSLQLRVELTAHSRMCSTHWPNDTPQLFVKQPIKGHCQVKQNRADRPPTCQVHGALLHEYPVGVGSRVVGRLWP